LSESEISELNIPKFESEPNHKNCRIENAGQLIQKCLNADQWSVTLFTSGTTGLPKKVTHTLKSLLRGVKLGAAYQDTVWGFTYNPTHIAGLQVLLQAFLNHSSVVDLYKKKSKEIFALIKEHNVTHISATPTFYRILEDGILKSVKRVTSGGEKLDQNTEAKIGRLFPNGKLSNIYASTEAGTLFVAKGDIFIVPENIKNLVRIENNELLISAELMGQADFLSEREWYHTGDLVEILNEEPLQFRFVSRKNEMINIGGMKVNPGEVEDVLLQVPHIRQVRVYGQENKLIGQILAADIVTDSDILEKEIRIFMKDKLQNYKIPRVINFVQALETTRTGKIKR
jgi:acyl-coenzyme A synthetase/AMP-(fatty) acid ligase